MSVLLFILVYFITGDKISESFFITAYPPPFFKIKKQKKFLVPLTPVFSNQRGAVACQNEKSTILVAVQN